jgi:hypothetical protein
VIIQQFLSTVHLRCLLKRVTSFIFRPADKQIFTGLSPWEPVLFHRGSIYSSDIHCMHLVLYQTGVQLLQHGSSSDRVSCELLHLPWLCIGDLCALFGPKRVLYGVHLEHIAQVSEFIRGAEFGETDIFHYFINFTPVFLALGPLLLDFSVWVPGHLHPVFDRISSCGRDYFFQPAECHDFPFLDPVEPPQCIRVSLPLVVPFHATFPSLCMSRVP